MRTHYGLCVQVHTAFGLHVPIREPTRARAFILLDAPSTETAEDPHVEERARLRWCRCSLTGCLGRCCISASIFSVSLSCCEEQREERKVWEGRGARSGEFSSGFSCA